MQSTTQPQGKPQPWPMPNAHDQLFVHLLTVMNPYTSPHLLQVMHFNCFASVFSDLALVLKCHEWINFIVTTKMQINICLNPLFYFSSTVTSFVTMQGPVIMLSACSTSARLENPVNYFEFVYVAVWQHYAAIYQSVQLNATRLTMLEKLWQTNW